jgi:CRP/FNR family cyclic AMP-dependent transcriptional regulator
MNMPPFDTRPWQGDAYLAEQAARLLRGGDALAGLSAADARQVVSYMRLLRCPEGHVLMREGEALGQGFMLLILDGEVTVEHLIARRADPVVVSVLGPGHVVGETGALDGGPRTATCIATTPVLGAGLSREALRRMVSDDPEVAARLLTGLSLRMAQRLRDTGRQLRVYQQLLGAMQGEIDALQRQLQRVMDADAARRGLTDTPPAD